MARLAAGEAHRLNGTHERCHVLEQQPAQLQILARGDVGGTIHATTVHRIGENLQLIGADHPIRQPHAHHETPRRHRPEKDAQPLEPNGEGGLIQRLPTLARQLSQVRGQIQATKLCLGLFNLAELGNGFHCHKA